MSTQRSGGAQSTSGTVRAPWAHRSAIRFVDPVIARLPIARTAYPRGF